MATADSPQRLAQKLTPPISLSCSQQRLPALNLWTAQPLLSVPILLFGRGPTGRYTGQQGGGERHSLSLQQLERV